jgi:2-alkenal reductase
MTRRTLHFPVALLLIVSFALLTTTPSQAQQATPTAQGAQQEMTPIQVVENVGPAVVTVINEQQAESSAGGSTLVPAGSGSGFIISNDGHVVTNNHVVEGGDQFSVIYADGTKVDAKLIGADPVSDIAVVQVTGDVPGVVDFGDSTALKAGQSVLAMGSPLGAFTNTVTEGIVSALGRSLPPQETGSQSVYTNLIQHDAPINPGNSGGPLFNLSGQVVGVNTIGIPTAEQGVPVQGLFFAIPSNTVQKITQQLIDNGKVVYPYIGIVNPIALDPITAAQNNLSTDTGVYVTDVSADSPAANAGIQPGDIITAINGEKIDESHPFEEFLFEFSPGDTIELTIMRGSEEMQVQVKLAERPA